MRGTGDEKYRSLFIARVEDPARIWKVSELEAIAEEETVPI